MEPATGTIQRHLATNATFTALSRDGRLLAVNRGPTIFDADTGQVLLRLDHRGLVTGIEWSPDNRRVLTTGGPLNDIRIFDATDGQLLHSILPLHRDGKWIGERFSHDGRFVYAVSEAGHLRLWDAATAEAVTPRWKHADKICCMVHLSTHRGLLVTTEAGGLCAWEFRPTSLPADVLAEYATLISGRRLSANGNMLPVHSQELVELSVSLRDRAPELFSIAPRGD